MQMASSIKLAQLNELTEGEVINTPDPPGETGTLALTDGELLVEITAEGDFSQPSTKRHSFAELNGEW